MGKSVSHKLIESHLLSGEMKVGEQIGIKIDQTLTQDATGTMVMLELEALHLDRARTDVSVQYIDHNIVQADNKNPDDHLFLQTAAARFGVVLSKAGNGISHCVHSERFAVPGKTMVGSDSHTPANGCMGMLAIGTGGLEVALAIAGEPFYVNMPKIMGVKLTGALSDWVSAKDVILEMLRRYDVAGGVGKIIEYYGPGLANLTAMDRHVIANMGAELGATTTVFPSDDMTQQFLKQVGRENDYISLEADNDATYDEQVELDLSKVEPLIAMPSSPGNVVTVKEVAGKPIYQAYIGSSANPCIRDFAVPAMVIDKARVADMVSLDINPSSRQVLNYLTEGGYLGKLTRAGSRVHQAGCNGCIGMGQAPATKQISLRTVPRNFPGRSGTKEDQVYLCSPETAIASAIEGKITDPRDLKISYPKFSEPESVELVSDIILPPKDNESVEILKGPNIGDFVEFDDLADVIEAPALLKVGDNITTDHISPAGLEVLPYRSNIPKLSEFTYARTDETYYKRAMDSKEKGSFIIGGANYGQGSSREHAAIQTRYLGVKAVITKSFARIHRKNLINFGVLPLTFQNEGDYDKIDQGDVLELHDIHQGLETSQPLTLTNKTKNETYQLEHKFLPLERESLLAGSLIALVRAKHKEEKVS